MPRVVTFVSDTELERRRRLGLDRFDEMWDGVLHMPPPPGTGHQYFETELVVRLHTIFSRGGERAYLAPNTAVADPARWPLDFRVPDVVVCRDWGDVHDRFVSSADLAVEVRSPDDETYDKLPFYAGRRVEEILEIDRHRGRVELHRRDGSEYGEVVPGKGGWVTSGIDVEFRWDADLGTLRLRAAGSGGDGESVPLPPR